MSDNNTNSNTPSSNNSGSGGNTLSTHTFQPNIKVNFANQQISLNSKFIESVSTKIKQLKEEANNEQDNQKKLAIINKYQNIEAMLKSSLMEYKQKFQQQQQLQQQQQQQSNNNNSNNSNSNSNNSNTPNNPISIKNYLTDEQKLHYANINKQFQQKTQQIVSTFDNNKKELEKILEKIKITNPETMKKEMDDLLAMKTKYENNGKTLQAAYKNLEVQMSDLKKRFYLKCSESNPELKKALMMVQMSQQQKQQQQQQQQQAAAQQSSTAQQQQSATQQSTPQQPQPQNKKQNNTASTQSKNVNTTTPQQPPTANSAQKKQKTAPTPTSNSQKQQLPQTSGDNILKPTIHENSLLTDVSTNITPVPIKEIPYKKDATQPTISAGYLGSNPILSQPLNRVLPQQASTANNNNATTAAVPTGKKNAYVPTPQDHILTKRKLRDLLKQYNGNSANIDGDVEELLLDLSDNFIEQVVKFGGKVAKLRKSENLEVKDVKFALEKGFGLEL
ncbi:hypothetical protein ACO0SA_004209 [Hanseniaspora valbyensis]